MFDRDLNMPLKEGSEILPEVAEECFGLYNWDPITTLTALNEVFCEGSLPKECPYSDFFWSYFPAFGLILHISPYSVQIRENTDQKNSEHELLPRSGFF